MKNAFPMYYLYAALIFALYMSYTCTNMVVVKLCETKSTCVHYEYLRGDSHMGKRFMIAHPWPILIFIAL